MLAVTEINDRCGGTQRREPPWFISISEPRREAVAAMSLKAEGFDCFYPVHHVTVVPPRRKVTLKMRNKLHLLAKSKYEPVFKSYIFIRPGPAHPGLRRVFQLRGVIGMVHFGEQLARVSNDLVESLRSGKAKKALDEHFSATPFPYKIGDTARLTTGALAEHNATIERVDESSESIHVLVSLFGRECRVITSVDQLEKIT